MRAIWYTLGEDGVPVPAADALEWARWFESHLAERIIAKDRVGDIIVSTIFLGIDHDWVGSGPPILFETMVFGSPEDMHQERYATIQQARQRHREIVTALQNGERIGWV